MSDEIDAHVGRLANEVALVSGAAGGIGAAVAELFVREGAQVVLGDVDPAVDELAKRLGESARPARLDVTVPGQWADAVELAASAFGQAPSVLVHVAGVMLVSPIDETPLADARRTFEINTFGTLHGIQSMVPGMRALGRGSIVVVSSSAGPVAATAGCGVYGASKAASTALAQAAAVELGHCGIRVNTLAPGGVDTPMSRSTGADFSDFFKSMPIPRMGEPSDIAYAACYFASVESDWVTGTTFLIDGGMLAGTPQPSR